MDINQITNAEMKVLAKAADKDGNGKLEGEEVSVFVKASEDLVNQNTGKNKISKLEDDLIEVTSNREWACEAYRGSIGGSNLKAGNECASLYKEEKKIQAKLKKFNPPEELKTKEEYKSKMDSLDVQINKPGTNLQQRDDLKAEKTLYKKEAQAKFGKKFFSGYGF